MTRLVLATAALLALVLPAGGASAAAVPRDFFGVMADGPLLDGSADLRREAGVMRRAGIGTVRLAVYWNEVQPTADAWAWDGVDAKVAALAGAGLTALPVLLRAPAWASTGTGEGAAPHVEPYARFAAAFVARYAAGGAFWAGRPGPARPVRTVQVWNEPDTFEYWNQPGWAEGYVALLRAARAAMKAVRPDLRVMAAGMTNVVWYDLAQLYRAGLRGAADVVAVHPYAPGPRGMLRTVRRARDVMDFHGDRRTPLAVTEMTYSSPGDAVRTEAYYGFETDEAGQGRRLALNYRALLRARRSLRLHSISWYTWISPPIGSPRSYDYAGLRRLLPGGGVVDKPALRALRRVVREAR